MLYDKRKKYQAERVGFYGRMYLRCVVNCYTKNCTSYTISKIPEPLMRHVGEAIVKAMGYRGVQCKILVVNIKGPKLIIHYVHPL